MCVRHDSSVVLSNVILRSRVHALVISVCQIFVNPTVRAEGGFCASNYDI